MQLILDNLSCRRSGRLLFKPVSSTLDAGEALIITGRNGAGKSSLLSIIAGRLEAEIGQVRFEAQGDAPLLERLHWIGHRDGLKGALNARENLTFAQAMLGGPRLDPDEALARVGLAHAAHLPVSFLSAGQRRRTALARLLVSHRPLWLLDEPSAALDVAGQELLVGLMEAHLQEGGLIVAATHLPLGLAQARALHLEPSSMEEALI